MAPEQALRAGITRRAETGIDVQYRFAAESDDIEALTALLHRAYASLAEAGLHYVASHQSSDVTRRRMAKGDTIVALSSTGTLIGTVTLARAAATSGSPLYDRPDVASCGQFGVEPALQGIGIGSTLLSLVEALAFHRGVSQLALDTSEQATALIRFYTARGYEPVESVTWPQVNYTSIIFTKARAHLRQAI